MRIDSIFSCIFTKKIKKQRGSYLKFFNLSNFDCHISHIEINFYFNFSIDKTYGLSQVLLQIKCVWAVAHAMTYHPCPYLDKFVESVGIGWIT